MCLYTINCKFYQTFTLLYKILQVLFVQAGNAEKTVSIHGTTQQLLKICSRTSRYPANFNVGDIQNVPCSGRFPRAKELGASLQIPNLC